MSRKPTPGNLYIVATPIGNREDITLRAVRILGQVDIIAAEDTRHTRRLLVERPARGRMVALHEHNEQQRSARLVAELLQGASVALVSNAGTPSVSDPGYRLVQAAIEHDIPVVPVPGPSAAIAALSASGLATDTFAFAGFVSARKGKRLAQLKRWANFTGTVIFYESPRRICALIDELLAVMGNRPAVLAREMTKVHEEFLRGSLASILAHLKMRQEVKGECTLLVSGAPPSPPPALAAVKAELVLELGRPGARLSEVARRLAAKYSLPRNQVYSEALRCRQMPKDSKH